MYHVYMTHHGMLSAEIYFELSQNTTFWLKVVQKQNQKQRKKELANLIIHTLEL